MMRKFMYALAIVASVVASVLLFAGPPTMAKDAEGQLILLAAPILDDPYYASEAEAIIDFHIAFARRVAAPDRVLILAGEDTADTYADALGPEHVRVAPMDDIWVRDFGIMDAASSVMTRYTAAGQGGGANGQRDADAVQETHAVVLEEVGITLLGNDLLNDGGNWVYDGAGHAVVSTKFLADNKMTEAEARAALHLATGVSAIAFIDADEQGGLEHADGVVSFIDEGVLLVNAYDDDPDHERRLHADLKRGLPGISIHTIVNAYDGSEIYDSRFGSACGLYTNALVTHHAVYLPQFGIAEDAQALATVKALTDKKVIPLSSQGVCHMGGGVRCMSSQINLESAAFLYRQ